MRPFFAQVVKQAAILEIKFAGPPLGVSTAVGAIQFMNLSNVIQMTVCPVQMVYFVTYFGYVTYLCEVRHQNGGDFDTNVI